MIDFRRIERLSALGRIYVRSFIHSVSQPVVADSAARIAVFVRYSVLQRNTTAWVSSRTEDFEAYRDRILDPERLEHRLHLFRTVTLPSLDRQALAMQAGTREAILLVPDALPEGHWDILTGFAATRPWLSLVPVGADESLGDAITAIARRLATGSNCIATVRLDDDDGLAPTYMARLSGYVRPALAGHVISFTRGERLEPDSGRLTQVNRPLLSAGMAYIAATDPVTGASLSRFPHILAAGSHTQIFRTSPTLFDWQAPQFVQSVHRGQDSA